MKTLPPFPIEELELSNDYELGALLLGWYVAACAEPHGFLPDIPDDFAQTVISQVKSQEGSPENAALEKALYKAAEGNFEEAGLIFRDYIQRGAHHMAAVRIAGEEREKNLKGPRKGGEARKQAVASKHAERNKQIVIAYQKLLGSGKSARDIPSILSRRFSLTPTRIRQILKEKQKSA